jgi:hypothetical protein
VLEPYSDGRQFFCRSTNMDFKFEWNWRRMAVWTVTVACLWLGGAANDLGQSTTVAPVEKASAPVATKNPQTGSFVPSVYKTFAAWKRACERAPMNRTLRMTLPLKELQPLQTFAQFTEVVDAFFELSKRGSLSQDSAWQGTPPVQPAFFNTDAVYFMRPPIPFQPFVQRELVPAGSQVFFHGDLHGDVHSLVAWMDWLNQKGYLHDFKVARPDVYLVFLGDYTDRGMYGVEVLYTLLRLKVENPDRVWLVRGNHEDVSITSRYGFLAEARGKFGRDFDAKRVMRL